MKFLFFVGVVCLVTADFVESAPFYTSFRWSGGPSPVRAYRSDGLTSLPAGSTMLVFLSTTDSTITWDPNWTDGTDGGFYGASGNDVFLQAISCGPAGGYNTGFISQNPATYGGQYTYFVLVDTPFSSSTPTLLNGSDYALLGSTYQITAFDQATAPGLSQTFSPGETLITSSHISIVPEPSTMALLACGMGVIAMRRRRKQE